MAHLQGATYDFTLSSTGSVDILSQSPNGTYTDPSNPTFCIGPGGGCNVSSGMDMAALTFHDVSPGSATITFAFFGSTDDSTGTFAVDLGGWSLLGGEHITGVTYASGNLNTGDFTSVSFNGHDAIFTGTSTGLGFNAIGGDSVVFNVSTAVPEASTWAMMLLGLASLGFAGHRASRKTPAFTA
jgi:hypothetical protein